MKRVITLILAAVLVLSLAGCSKTPQVSDLMNYPVNPGSLADCESFLKKCGYDITFTSATGVNFTDGYWEGTGYTDGVMLRYSAIGKSNVDFDKEVSSARAMLKELCGPAYSSNESNMLYTAVIEFYTCGSNIVAFSVSYMGNGMDSMEISIFPGQAS